MGWHVNQKRVYRIYREEGLNLRPKRLQRRLAAAHQLARPEISCIDECWFVDFVAANPFNGSRTMALTVIENWCRECLAVHVDRGIKVLVVVTVMERLRLFKERYPERIQLDTGREFFSKALDQQAHWNRVMLDCSRPEKSVANARIKSFNCCLKEECLNAHWLFCRLTMPGRRSNLGGKIITVFPCTRRWEN